MKRVCSDCNKDLFRILDYTYYNGYKVECFNCGKIDYLEN